jgi:hypothetical protein
MQDRLVSHRSLCISIGGGSELVLGFAPPLGVCPFRLISVVPLPLFFPWADRAPGGPVTLSASAEFFHGSLLAPPWDSWGGCSLALRGPFEKRKKALPSLALSSGEVEGEASGAGVRCAPAREPCKRLDGLFGAYASFIAICKWLVMS